MSVKQDLARKAYEYALKERKRSKVLLTSALCIFDFIQNLNIEIRFKDIPSMEGLYYNDGKPLIIVSSCRPRGRLAFNCAHEYAHHVFDHGTRVDEVVDSVSSEEWQPDEFLADSFAGFILMPKLAVFKAFSLRGWDVNNCTPSQVFCVASYMGVGYVTLVTHMFYSLGIISQSHHNELINTSPKELKSIFTGDNFSKDVVILDNNWEGKPVDLSVGDIVVVELGTELDGNCLENIGSFNGRLLFKAVRQGISRAFNDSLGWASYLRVSREHYEGLSNYRHFPEVDNG